VPEAVTPAQARVHNPLKLQVSRLRRDDKKIISTTFYELIQKKNQKKTPVSSLTLRVAKPGDEAALYAAMLCCKACSGTHNLAIAAHLASRCALPGSIILASSTGLCSWRMRNLALLRPA
jgi:hypothetical protein